MPEKNEINEIEMKDGAVLKKDGTDWSLTRGGAHLRFLSEFEARFVNAAIAATNSAHKARAPLEAGDKVFVVSEQKLATVLNVYGNGLTGSYGEVRVDLCGNTPIKGLERYDAKKHAAFDHTFVPIMRGWKRIYGITQDVPVRDIEAPEKRKTWP